MLTFVVTSESVKGAMTWKNSIKKKYIVGIKINASVVESMTLLCIRYSDIRCLFFKISDQVKNPIPPITINNIMVIFITFIRWMSAKGRYIRALP